MQWTVLHEDELYADELAMNLGADNFYDHHLVWEKDLVCKWTVLWFG